MDKRLARRFAAFYFLLYLRIGMQAPYLFLYFKRVGFTDTQLGTLAALPPLLNVLSPPVWGAVADAFGDRRRTLALLLVLGAVSFPWLMYTTDFGLTLALLVLFALFSNPPGAITDAIALENVERGGGDYGRLRLWGSLGFAAPLLAFGLILKKGAGEAAGSLYPMFVGYTIFRLVSAGWVGALPASRGGGNGRFDLRGARAFASARFLALAGCAVVATAAMSGYYLYFSIYLDEVGIADNLKGYFWVIAVGAETGMMLVIGRVIQRLGLKWTFVLSLVWIAGRLFAFSFALGPAGIAAVQCLHALTFTAFTVSSIMFVNELTPPELRASGQSVWMAVTRGLGSAAGSKMAGVTAGALGLMGMFRVYALAAAATVVAAAVLVRGVGDRRAPDGEE
jgi:PPP family 3-phenylpropionic acid transporter